MDPTPAPSPRFAFERRPRGLRGWLAGKRGKAALALAAAVTVPAMAAPAEWSAFEPATEDAPAALAVASMPFEQAGQSFPGSAFYYLEDAAFTTVDYAPPAVETSSDTKFYNPLEVMSGDPAKAVELREAGPAARAFRAVGSGIDQARALQCLATAVYYEAASEGIGGQKAVAQVVLNRVAHPTYPGSVCGVVYQGSERSTGCQFSFTCDGSLARKASATAWARALRVAREALAGDVYAPVGLATHYHTTWVNPYWAPSLDYVGTIGAHRFYRWRGAAGRPAAFASTYRGAEPLPRPVRQAAANTAAISTFATPLPVAEPRAGIGRIATGSVPAPAGGHNETGTTADRLPQSGNVRPEFARAGQWKVQD